MKDITAILVYYSSYTMLHKAINSLGKIGARLESTIILQERKMDPSMWPSQIEWVKVGTNDHGQLLNDIIGKLTTSYVLFLCETDYLSPTIHPGSLDLPDTKSVLETDYYNRNIAIHRPVLVRTSLLKRERFLLQSQLPFKKALLPAWLANVESSQQLMKRDLVRQTRKDHSTNTVQKEKMIQKYQLKKVNISHPTISIIMSTYNTEKYVETAVLSCLLQSQTFDQILVMDDGSTDDSYGRLKRLENKNQIKVFHKKNEGKAKALNELLNHVTSDFILELDADDWLDPDACFVIKKHLSELPNEVSVLYGNLKKWKQSASDILFKEVAKGTNIKGTNELLSYRFPLGPRIYRTSALKKEGRFPVIAFEEGRLYEDVSVLYRLLKKYPFCYKDFTVYNVRGHSGSITKNDASKWREFLKVIKNIK